MEDEVIINMGHNDQDNVITEKPHSRAITRDDAVVPSPNVEISNTSIRFGQEKDSIDSSTKVIQVNQTSSWKNEELEDCIYDDFTNMGNWLGIFRMLKSNHILCFVVRNK
jgi:hypothetical protein